MIRDFLLILKAEFKRDLLFMKRYPLEPLSFLFFMYMILLSILLGLSQLVSEGRELSTFVDRERMILGYTLMQFVFSTQMGWSGQMQYESQTGTLEQLSLSGHSLGGVLLARGISQLLRQTLSFYLLLGAYVLSLPGLALDPIRFPMAVPVLLAMAAGIYGISYLFAGITLLFKRVGMFFQIVNFAFLGIFWLDRSSLEKGGVTAMLYDHFPLSVGMSKMQEVLLTEEGSLSSTVSYSWIRLLLISFLYFGAGFLAFRRMEKKSRELGLLSQY